MNRWRQHFFKQHLIIPHPQFSGFEFMFLKVGAQDRIGILLVYHPPCCSILSIPERTELVLEIVVESPWLVLLGDLSVPALSRGLDLMAL